MTTGDGATAAWSATVPGEVVTLVWGVVSRYLMAGRTGQSVGKKIVGLVLLSERTGRPLGIGRALLRDVAHAVDGASYVGYLWPLWDSRRQTLADKLLHSVVLPTEVTDR